MDNHLDETRDAIAVVGMGAVLPMADDVWAFWTNLLDGRECLTHLDDADRPGGGSRVSVTGALERPYHFDYEYFGLNKTEARLMDPQQRVMLECAVQAWNDAGLETSGLAERGGVFVGSTINTYLPFLLRQDASLLDRFSPQQIMLAHDKDFSAARVARALGFRGSASTVQTACSSSLSAVHYARQALLSGECDVALAGGVSVRVPHWSGYDYVEGGTFSADGHIRAFDAAASGSIPGSGAGAVILMRLADATAGGRRIHAVLRGTAIAIDGGREGASFTGTTASGQAQAAFHAWRQANFSGGVDFIECHGTGTLKGDPIEVRGLAQAYDAMRWRDRCLLTSAKPNIGHLDAAAGVAGFLKACLIVRERRLPPQINFDTPNPAIPWADSPFDVASGGHEFDPTREVTAAVNSLGMGGFNVHVALSSPPAVGAEDDRRRHVFVLPVSAATEPALAQQHEAVEREVGEAPPNGLADLERVLLHGRQTKKIGTVSLIRDKEVIARQPMATSDEPVRVPLWVLPGQGVLQANMGLGLAEVDRAFASTFSCLAARAADLGGPDLSGIGDEDPSTSPWWRDTFNVQTAVFCIQVASAAMVRSWGCRPSILVGHSLGELSALAIAGVYPVEALLEFVIRRAAAIRDAPDGAMMSVAAPAAELEQLLASRGDQAWIAAENAPGRTVVGGTSQALSDLAAALEVEGLASQLLPVSRAFHTPLLDGARYSLGEAFNQVLKGLEPITGDAVVVSSALARPLRRSDLVDRSYWVEQSLSRVRFVEALAHPITSPADLVLDLGPSEFAGTCARQVGRECVSVTLLPRRATDAEEAAARAHMGLLAARAERTGASVRPSKATGHRGHRYVFDSTELSLLSESHRNDSTSQPTTEPQEVKQSMPSSPGSSQVQHPGRLEADVTITASEVNIRIRADGSGSGTPVTMRRPMVESSGLAHDATAPPTDRGAADVPERSAANSDHAPKASSPGSSSRDTVLRIFTEQLGLDPLPTDVPVDSLGADSLTLTHILSVLKKEVAPALSMRELTDAGSLDELCEHIARPSTSRAEPDTQAETGSGTGAAATGSAPPAAPAQVGDAPLWPKLPSIEDELASAAREGVDVTSGAVARS